MQKWRQNRGLRLYLIMRCISVLIDDNYTKTENSHRYVEVWNENSIDQFRNEIAIADIYNKLDLNIIANPIVNYKN